MLCFFFKQIKKNQFIMHSISLSFNQALLVFQLIGIIVTLQRSFLTNRIVK